MHDNQTLAHTITLSRKDKYGHREPFITIWHCDPETDGTDDSCGWFPRARHGDQKILEKIKSEFDFNLKHHYWFDENGVQIFSTIGTMLLMYRTALYVVNDGDRSKTEKFMTKHLYNIMIDAENPHDCIGDSITNRWAAKTQEEQLGSLPSIIYGDILRKSRKWYQHPKWHVHHWKIQFDFIRRIKRKYFTKKNDNDVCNVKS